MHKSKSQNSMIIFQ